MFTEKVLVRVSEFGGSTSGDKNGERSIFLTCLAGKIPNRNTIAGTVAQRSGFEVGKVYLVQVIERGTSVQFGPRYQFQPLMEITDPVKIIEMEKELGSPIVFEVPTTDYVKNEYQRKTDKVISQERKEIEAGTFIPSRKTQGQVQHLVENPGKELSEKEEEIASKNG